MAHRFFLPGSWSCGEIHSLDSEQSHHATRVLRLQPGDVIHLFNGDGVVGTAIITETGRKDFKVRIGERNAVDNPWKLTVAFSLGKPPVTEFVLKRLTEIGVRRFQPLRTQHSHPGDFKLDRWRKILLEVGKQCQETHLPVLEPLRSLDEWLNSWSPRPIFVCDEFDRMARPAKTAVSAEVAVLVGSEGGWDTSELALFDSLQACKLGLGKNRLRAETAALVAAVSVKKLLGELPI